MRASIRPVFLTPLLLASACAVGPDFVRPESPKDPQFTSGQEPSQTVSADGKAQRFDTGYELPSKWWQLFNSSKLDPIVARALEKNQNVQAALATLRQTQSNLTAGYGVFYPSVSADLTAEREKSNPRSFGVNAPSSIFNVFSLSASITYALDVFGGARRALEGLQAQVESQRYTVLATYLTLTSNVVNTVIARAAYQAQIEATQSMILLLKEQRTITEAQVRASTAPYTNLLSIQSQLSSIEATLPPLRQKLKQADHLLANLSGQTPAEWTPIDITLSDLHLPDQLPKELPSRLARRRPDILMSEALLHLSSARIGVATAALYPSLTLNATLGRNAVDPEKLFQGGSSFWNLGAGLTAPLFQGGQLLAQKQAAVEAYQASLAEYRQTVLTAFSQVADALRALEHDAELVKAQADALKSAQEASQLVQANYRAGTAPYLQVLTVNSQYHQASIGYLQAVAQRLQDTVTLFAALGGGWWK